MDKTQMMVTVIVRAFMQEQMIRQALDSIVAQKTTYPFEVIIGENHSTDYTLDICREYEENYENIKMLAHEKNIGAQRNLAACIAAGTGKYIMICDADDWWHNPNKLQMQVEYMEAHPNCVVLHTDNNVYNDKTGKTKYDIKKASGRVVPEGKIQKELFSGKVSVCWPTCCIRRSAFEKYVPIDEFIKNGMFGEDYPTWAVLSAYGDVNYMPISTVTYRIGHPSATNEANYDKILSRRESDKNVLKMLYSMFPELGTYHEEEWFDNFYSHRLLLAAYRNNDYPSAKRFAKQDKMPNWQTWLAYTWLTFQLGRLLRYI